MSFLQRQICLPCVIEYFNVLMISLQDKGKLLSKFSSNSEVDASELLETLEYKFARYLY